MKPLAIASAVGAVGAVGALAAWAVTRRMWQKDRKEMLENFDYERMVRKRNADRLDADIREKDEQIKNLKKLHRHDEAFVEYLMGSVPHRKAMWEDVQELFEKQCEGRSFTSQLLDQAAGIRDAVAYLEGTAKETAPVAKPAPKKAPKKRRKPRVGQKNGKYRERKDTDLIYTIPVKEWEDTYDPGHDKIEITVYSNYDIYLDEFGNIVHDLDQFGWCEGDFGVHDAGPDEVFIRNEQDHIDFHLIRTDEEPPADVMWDAI